MIRRPTHSVDVLPGNLVVAAAILIVLPIIGTAGYMVLEGWSFLDALYMTIITLTTVGFREVRELDDSGRIFTMLLIILASARYCTRFSPCSSSCSKASWGYYWGDSE